MYAVIRQERESTVADKIFQLLLKCNKWLCYAVCGNLRMQAEIRQERESTVTGEMFLAVAKVS